MFIIFILISLLISIIFGIRSDTVPGSFFNETIIANISKIIELKCRILLNLTNSTNVIWRYNNITVNETLPRTRFKIDFNGTLVIKKLNYNDSNIYICEATDNRTYAIKLVVKGPPSNFISFSYTSLSYSEIKLHWKIEIGEYQSVPKYKISLCKEPNKTECQNKSSDYPHQDTTIPNLKPFSNYNASIIAFNDFGENQMSSITVKTRPGPVLAIPFANFTYVGESNVTILIDCKQCLLEEKMGGVLDHYVIKYEYYFETIIKWNTTNSTIEDTVRNLQPNSPYRFYIYASNGEQQGPEVSFVVTTKESLPDPVTGFKVIDTTSNEIKVSWKTSRSTMEYILQVSEYKTFNITTNYTMWNDYYHKQQTITNLKPRHKYFIRIVARNNIGMSSFVNITAKTDRPALIPPKLSPVKIINNSVRVSWKNNLSVNETADIEYQICWKSQQNGPPLHCIVTAPGNFSGSISCNCNLNKIMHSVDIPKADVHLDNSQLFFWVTLNVGKDKCYSTCSMRVISNESRLDLNGHRKSNNENGQLSNALTTVLIVGSILFIAGFIIFFYFWGNNNLKSLIFSTPSNGRYMRPSPEYIEVPQMKLPQPRMLPLDKTPHPPIPLDNLVEHIKNYRCDDGAGFQTEFEAIEAVDNSRWSITYPILKENKNKNRYTNIFPYDHSRVILHSPHNGKYDYINASFIDGYNRSNAYIATQGPLPDTIGDFWQMVYEQNSEIIVMISNFEERGRRKCEVYWGPNKVVTYGNISVRQTFHRKMAFYTERRFCIKNARNKKNACKERTIYHYQYTDWRDFDVPPSSLPVLVFVKATISHWSNSSGPIIVHCSAGVGRTGTYICIESQIRQMQLDRTINVRGFLEHIRQQRMKLVQTESQYTFIHDALYEYFLCNDHQIHKDMFTNYLLKLQLKSIDTNGASKLDEQFQMCTELEPTNYEYIQSKKPFNVSKNRSDILPIESRRINLSSEPGIEGSNYINASAIQGYWDMKEFIITQHPLEETEPDFWKMVWDENCSVIILLSDTDLPQFWPANENEYRKYRGSQVNYCNSEENGNINQYGFLLSSQREDYALNCTMHHLKEWPDSVSDCADLLSLLFKVNAEKDHFPMVVIDNVGGSHAGMFVALSSLLNQLRTDDVVDVYFVMKMIHMERPRVFRDSGDLKFVYELLDLIISNLSAYSFFAHKKQPDSIPNGVCHSKPPPNHYATLTSIRSRSSTARRRASSAESSNHHSPVRPRGPLNRISWHPGETRFSAVMDVAGSPVRPRPSSVKTVADLPVAVVLPRTPSDTDTLVVTDV